MPGVTPPIFKKQPAPSFRYVGSCENGMPLRFDKKGRNRSTKRAYKSKEIKVTIRFIFLTSTLKGKINLTKQGQKIFPKDFF